MKSENNFVYIIILNYNGWKDTIECLESVYRINYNRFKIIVLDNDSIDGSIENIIAWANGKLENNNYSLNKIMKPLPYIYLEANRHNSYEAVLHSSNYNLIETQLIIIKIEENIGFSGGNNVGIRYALNQKNCEFVWLLNNDTIVEKNTLTEMVSVAYKSPNVGVVGSTIKYYNYPNEIEHVCGGQNLLYSFILGNSQVNKNLENKMYEDITGSSFLIPSNVINDVGLLDEDYFLYREESDYCWRIRHKEYELLCASNSIVYHKSAASSGGKGNPRTYYYLTRNTFLFFRKNIRNPIYFLTLSVLFFFARFIKVLILLLQGKRIQGRAIMHGLLDGIRNIKGKMRE